MVNGNIIDINNSKEIDSAVRWFKIDEQIYLQEVRQIAVTENLKKGFEYFANTFDNTVYLNDINLALVVHYTVNAYGRLATAKALFFNLFTFKRKEEKQVQANIKYETKEQIIKYFAENPKENKVMVRDNIEAKKVTYFYPNKTVSRVVYYDTQRKRFTKEPKQEN